MDCIEKLEKEKCPTCLRSCDKSLLAKNNCLKRKIELSSAYGRFVDKFMRVEK